MSSLPFQTGGGGAFFIKNIMVNFMFYQNQLQANLFQFFSYQQISELFSR